MCTETEQAALDEYHKAACDMSYYNAAEGPSYYAEAEGRGKAQARLRNAADKCRELGLIPENKGYLL